MYSNGVLFKMWSERNDFRVGFFYQVGGGARFQQVAYHLTIRFECCFLLVLTQRLRSQGEPLDQYSGACFLMRK